MKKISILLASLTLLTSVSEAKKQPIRTVKQILPEIQRAVTINGKSVNTVSGVPITLTHVNYKAFSNNPESIGLEFLNQHLQTLQLKQPDINELKLTHVRKGLASTTVRFKQYYQGLEVYNSNIAISYNKNNTINYVNNSLKPLSTFKRAKTYRTVDAAMQLATDYLGKSFIQKDASIAQVIYQQKTQSILAYKIEKISNSMRGNWVFIIDAQTGKILMAKDTNNYQNATTTVFDPDPLSSSGSGYIGNYRDNNDTTNASLDAELFSKDLELDTSGSTFFLRNNFAESVDVDSPNDGIFSQNNSEFNYNRADAAFESSNTFYHLDTYLKYLNTDLGLTVKPYQYSGGIKFDAHGANGADNSFYSSTGLLVFGEGCVDDGEDADVVIHELGHGIHDWITNGNLSQVNGLSEGTGDYFAQSYSRSRSNQVWNSNQAAYHYMFSWDGHNECWQGRTTNYNRTYPGGLVNQIHTDGQIWATCLMKVWDQIGADNTDSIVVEGLAMTGSNTNQEQAAQAVLQAAVDLGMNQNISTIQSIFNACGYDVMVEVSSLSVTVSQSGDSTINNDQTFTATIQGGTAPYTYAWDINNDMAIDGNEANISANYTQTYSESVTVTVTDSTGATANGLLVVNINAPNINLVNQANSLMQLCGNNDAFVDPGERWQMPVTLQNNGFLDANGAYAVFNKRMVTDGLNFTAQDNFGNAVGSCASQFIDISQSGIELVLIDAQPNDSLTLEDEGSAVVNLSQSFDFYGQSIQSITLSTNGYISTDPDDTGVNFANGCPLPSVPENQQNGASSKARIMPMHDDLITQHIYHQHFENCPRSSVLGQNLACDVFMYADVDLWSTQDITEHFNFEAILYATVNQWVFQYDGEGYQPDSSSVGIQNDLATDGVGFSCNAADGFETQSAVCVYHKNNQGQSGGDTSFVNLETPVIGMGNMPISGQHSDFVSFSVAEDASCGSAINIDYQAAVYSAGFNAEGSSVIATSLGNNGVCNVVNNCSPNNSNGIDATNGLWYNPSRSGNGNDMYFSESNLTYLQYTALEDRSPIWYITNSNSSMQNNQSYNEMAKISYTGPFLSSTQTSTVIGESLTTLINSDMAVQTRTINGQFSAEIIQSFSFSGNATPQQRTGLWYNELESGWGVSVGTQGDTEVLINYLYDDSGQPYWVLGSGANAAVEDINMSYFNAFCPHCPSVPVLSNAVGTVTIDYGDSNQTAVMESMQINVDSPEHTGSWTRMNMPLELLTPPIED